MRLCQGTNVIFFFFLSTGPQNCYAVLRFDKSVGQEEDAYMIACYIPPEGSPALNGKGPAVWEEEEEDYICALTKPHGSCRGPSGPIWEAFTYLGGVT